MFFFHLIIFSDIQTAIARECTYRLGLLTIFPDSSGGLLSYKPLLANFPTCFFSAKSQRWGTFACFWRPSNYPISITHIKKGFDFCFCVFLGRKLTYLLKSPKP